MRSKPPRTSASSAVNNLWRFPLLSALAGVIFFVGGCNGYKTATKAQVDDEVQRYEGNSFGAKLVFEKTDGVYDYYLIEDQTGQNVFDRYRVPHGDQGDTSPAENVIVLPATVP
jgi:hypothetical protein